MNELDTIELQDCPFCGGPALLEEEEGWSFYVMCADCGSQTAGMEYKSGAERTDTAQKVADLWNRGKVNRANPNE